MALGDLSDMEVRLAHRAAAAVVERRGGAARHREIHAAACAPDAPWCPSNIEFIRRINGLDSIDEVKRIVFDASYLVLGLGDVYLGAPVATPVDPRHRLVTTKYNPARTWTPENVVGIGGAYLCIYGMEGPGGYQLFGRTCQMWNTYRVTDAFEHGKPWLLRFFDQHQVLSGLGRGASRFSRRVLAGQARRSRSSRHGSGCRDYLAFLDDNADADRRLQGAAASRLRSRARRVGKTRDERDELRRAESTPTTSKLTALLPAAPPRSKPPVPGSVWKILVEPGREVAEGETLIIVEVDEDGDRGLRAVERPGARGALRRGQVGASSARRW